MKNQIVIHNGNESTPLQEAYKKLKSNIDAMIAQWLEDYSNFQAANNVRKGIAGTEEYFKN